MPLAGARSVVKTKIRFNTTHAKVELAGIVFLLLPVIVAAVYLAYDPFVSGKVLLGLLFTYVTGVAAYVISLRLISRTKSRRPPATEVAVHRVPTPQRRRDGG